jgi:hypothetical protein
MPVTAEIQDPSIGADNPVGWATAVPFAPAITTARVMTPSNRALAFRVIFIGNLLWTLISKLASKPKIRSLFVPIERNQITHGRLMLRLN